MDGSASHPARPEADAPLGTAAVVEGGVLSGMLGAAVVALFFLAIDSLRGAPLATPHLLGSVLFRGLEVGQVGAVEPTIVFAYTGLHVLLFVLSGLALAVIVSQFIAHPQVGMLLVLLFAIFQAVLFGFEVTLVPKLVGALGALSVALANVLSTAVMFWFLLNRHPQAIERLRRSFSE